MKGFTAKLIAYLAVLSLLLLILTSVAEYHAGSMINESELHEVMDAISTRLIVNLSQSVQELDAVGARAQILNEFTRSNVFAIYVWADSGRQLLAGLSRTDGSVRDSIGNFSRDDLFSQRIEIKNIAQSTDEVSGIGSVEIFLDKSHANARLMKSVLNNVIKVAVVLIFLLGVFHILINRYLVKPLVRIKSNMMELANAAILPLHHNDNGKIKIPPLLEIDSHGFQEIRQLGQIFQSMVSAIQDRQIALAQSQRNYQEIFNATTDAIFLHDSENGEILEVNQSMLDMFGYSYDQARKITLPDISADSSSATHDEALRLIHLAVSNGMITFDWHCRRSNNELFWVEVILRSAIINGTQRVLAIVRDISHRKLAEDAIRQNQLQLERMVRERTHELELKNEELEAFSYSVSHDLRAPLRAIDGFSQILLEDYRNKLDEGAVQTLMRVRGASQRMGKLIDDILNLSRINRSELKFASVNLSVIAQHIITQLQQIEPVRDVKVSIQPDLYAHCDAVLIETLLQNLINNAWKYTGKSSQPLIEIGCIYQKNVNVYFIKDNGVGFDMKYEKKIYGTFERLHSENDFPGTGIGLATVRRILDRHNGKIWAQSEVGKGAVFYFTLGSDYASQAPPVEHNAMKLNS